MINRTDLFALQNLERAIFENVIKKTFMRLNVLYQFKQTIFILDSRDGFNEITHVKDIDTYISNMPDWEIIVFIPTI